MMDGADKTSKGWFSVERPFQAVKSGLVFDVNGSVNIGTAAMKPVPTRPGTVGQSTKVVSVMQVHIPPLLESKLIDDKEAYLRKEGKTAHCVDWVRMNRNKVNVRGS